MRLSAPFLLLCCALTGALACTDRVPGATDTPACTYALDCAVGEACVAGTCVKDDDPPPDEDSGPPPEEDSGPPPEEDSGPPPEEDGGPPPDEDAGPTCTADDLNNNTPETAYEVAVGDIDDGRIIEGRMCGDDVEYFEFFGYQDDRYQVALSWVEDGDADLRLYEPGDASGQLIGASTHREIEVTSGRLPLSGDYVLSAALFLGEPVTGLGYDLQIRTGFPCMRDDDAACGGDATFRCLMPLWTPSLASGAIAPSDDIFLGGLCAKPYEPCLASDNTTGGEGGETTSRTDAIVGMPNGSAWSCRFDADWYRYDLPQDGDLTLTFSNTSSVPATYLVSVFDDAGNMVMGMGYRDLEEAQPRDIEIRYLDSATPLWVRVFMLSDDNFATYSLAATPAAATCTGDPDCVTADADLFGRSQCLNGACVCPGGACSAP